MALTTHTPYPEQTWAPDNHYYRHHFLESIPACNEGDRDMTFIVRDGTDLLLFAQSAARFWKSAGNCPTLLKERCVPEMGTVLPHLIMCPDKKRKVILEPKNSYTFCDISAGWH